MSTPAAIAGVQTFALTNDNTLQALSAITRGTTMDLIAELRSRAGVLDQDEVNSLWYALRDIERNRAMREVTPMVPPPTPGELLDAAVQALRALGMPIPKALERERAKLKLVESPKP